MKNIILTLILFCCMTSIVLAQNKIKQYEYWLDNDYAGKQTVSITATANLELDALVPINGLKQGLHTFNIRFLDTNNRYSSIVTKHIEAFTANPKIVSYEYWFDDAYASKTQVPLSALSVVEVKDVNISSLSNGYHTMNFRFSDNSSKWSAVQRNRILKSSGSTMQSNTISAYKYWVDADIANSISKDVSSVTSHLNLNENIDLSVFPVGYHVLNIQFKDCMGIWSSIQRKYIYNAGQGTLLKNAITNYRYWTDSNFSKSISRMVNPALAFVSVDEYIDLTEFKGDNRKLYVQFKDALGMWSSITTDTVSVIGSTGVGNVRLDDGTVNVFPNPNKGRFGISTTKMIADVNISVFNSLGESIYVEHSNLYNGNTIDLKNVQPGIYYLQIVDTKNANNVITKKIILQN